MPIAALPTHIVFIIKLMVMLSNGIAVNTTSKATMPICENICKLGMYVLLVHKIDAILKHSQTIKHK